MSKYIDADQLKAVLERQNTAKNIIEPLIRILDTLPEQPVEGLEEAAWDCVLDNIDVNNPVLLPKYKELLTYLFKAGAEWQKEQMMKEAVERVVKVDAGCYPYIDATELYDYEKDKPLAKAGDKVRVIVIKED